jgi:nucleotide-binding universal stress UspA family protein
MIIVCLKRLAMKQILVPTDFSDYADRALHYAAGIAQKTGAEILLLHVCELIHSPFADQALLINQYNDLKTSELTNRLDKVKAGMADSGVVVTAKLYEGDIADSILWVAEQENVDLIVMGTLGATGLKTVFFGTKTASVVSKSPVPVITVPFSYKWKTPKKFLIVTNDPKEDISLFEPVLQLGASFGARINIAIFSESTAHADELVEHSRVVGTIHGRLKKKYPESDLALMHLTGKDFYQALQRCVEEEKIDLLVMITHKRSGVQHLLKFSMTRQMSYHTTIPMLALHSTHPL